MWFQGRTRKRNWTFQRPTSREGMPPSLNDVSRRCLVWCWKLLHHYAFLQFWQTRVTNSMARIWPWWIQRLDAWILHASLWCNVLPLWTFWTVMVAIVCFILWGLSMCSNAQFGWLTWTLYSSHCRRDIQCHVLLARGVLCRARGSHEVTWCSLKCFLFSI